MRVTYCSTRTVRKLCVLMIYSFESFEHTNFLDLLFPKMFQGNIKTRKLLEMQYTVIYSLLLHYFLIFFLKLSYSLYFADRAS
jgi:hypothetical protein